MQKILVVEDDEELLNCLEMILSKEGYQVLKTSHGEMGLDIAVRENPNLIILDQSLPGISGLDVCQELRKKGIRAPIIIMSTKAETVDRTTGSYPDADDYISKPFGSRELLSRVNSHLPDNND